jgi:hypothetical protein
MTPIKTANSPEYRYSTFRLSGNILTVSKIKYADYPVRTSAEKSALRAKLHFGDKINALACHVGRYRRFIDEGWTVKFLTLTINREMSRTEFMLAWKKFRQRLERRFVIISAYPQMTAYVAVVERQKKSNRPHLHICIYCPYIQWNKLIKVWGEGGCYIEAVKEHEGRELNDLGGYMSKYLSKTFADIPEDDFGKKRFFSSRNIRRDVITGKQSHLTESIVDVMGDLKGEVYSDEYSTEYSDCTRYKFDVLASKDTLTEFRYCLNLYTKQLALNPKKRTRREGGVCVRRITSKHITKHMA